MSKCRYKEPEWSAPPAESDLFNLEVLKDGGVLEIVRLADKAYYVVGRDDEITDIHMTNASISRYHLVIQFSRTSQIFLYDVGSTHGTFLNKKKIEPRRYVELSVGDMFSLGSSTRRFLLNGPESMRPEEYESANLRKLRAKVTNANRSRWRRDSGSEPCESGKKGTEVASDVRCKDATSAAFRPFSAVTTNDDDGNDDDEYYDRTSKRRRQGNERRRRQRQGKTWTREELEKDMLRLWEEREIAKAEYERTVKNNTASSYERSADAAADDALDVFMRSTNSVLSKTEIDRSKSTLEDMQSLLDRRCELLRIARPSIAEMSIAGVVVLLVTERKHNKRDTLKGNDRSKATTENDRTQFDARRAVPAQMRFAVNVVGHSRSRDSSRHVEASSPKPPPSFAMPRPVVVVSEAAPAKTKMSVNVKDHGTASSSTTRTRSVAEGVATQGESRHAARRKRRRDRGERRSATIGPARPPSETLLLVAKRSRSEDSTLQGGTEIWSPPADQTGDGKTRLNEKFGY